jgi:hypothetical protein
MKKLFTSALLALGLFTSAATQPCSTTFYGEFHEILPYPPTTFTLRNAAGTYLPWEVFDGGVVVHPGDQIYIAFPPEAIRPQSWEAGWSVTVYFNGSDSYASAVMPSGKNFATWKVIGDCGTHIGLQLVASGTRLD